MCICIFTHTCMYIYIYRNAKVRDSLPYNDSRFSSFGPVLGFEISSTNVADDFQLPGGQAAASAFTVSKWIGFKYQHQPTRMAAQVTTPWLP